MLLYSKRSEVMKKILSLLLLALMLLSVMPSIALAATHANHEG